jgi:large subunit ribosomal protein L10
MLSKEQKQAQSQELRDRLSDVGTLFLLENRGLKVNDVNNLRSEVRKTDATYKVVKNTVVRLAVEGTEMEGITPFLVGPKVLAFTEGDGVALAKVLKTFIKTHPELSFTHAYLEGQILEGADAEKIADMPSRDELIAKLVNLLQSPIRRLAVALNAPLQGLATSLGQIAEKGGEPEAPEEQEASAEPEAAPEPEAAEEASAAEATEEPADSEAPAGDEEPQEAQASEESEKPEETEAS